MLVWSLVLSLHSVLQTTPAFPELSRQQYGSFGTHGRVATKVCLSIRSPTSRFFLSLPTSIGGGLLGDGNHYVRPRGSAIDAVNPRVTPPRRGC